MAELPQPWLEDALEQLDLRRRDRCLVLSCPTEAHVAAVSGVVGRTASIVVVEPELRLAERACQGKHENLEVLAYEPQGNERFGTFDALLACPLTTMGWPIALWCELIRKNLRPGGRFVLDLPGEVLCEPLRRAWTDLHAPTETLDLITGPSDSELADNLRRQGLRNVESSMGTHLLHLESPYLLAEFMHSLLPDDELRRSLALALVEILKSTEDVDVVIHRTRVHGQR